LILFFIGKVTTGITAQLVIALNFRLWFYSYLHTLLAIGGSDTPYSLELTVHTIEVLMNSDFPLTSMIAICQSKLKIGSQNLTTRIGIFDGINFD